MNSSGYADFLRTKTQLVGDFGFESDWFPSTAFDFQREIIARSCRKGRYAIFADTGLGKTLIQLAIAHNVVRKTSGRVLILTPLAVAFQFIAEAEKIGVPDVFHSKDGLLNGRIIVANYERLNKFSPSDFQCVLLDESSILKNFQGSTRDAAVAFMRKIPYRFLSTATPSPNDFIELGNSAEALGHMGYMDMLGKFFRNNQNSVDSNNRNIGEKFYLKPHAEKDFFAWVASWAMMVKMPSDIGFDDSAFVLPELSIQTHTIHTDAALEVGGQTSLFASTAVTMSEIGAEQKATVRERCEAAVILADGKTSVYWCNRNDESETIADMDDDALEIRGSMSIDQKEEALIAFSRGEIQRLVTKPKMTSMGLNWQHCSHTVFFPTWSYEQYYQSIRRFWRFGQKRPVTVDLVIGAGQERVVEAIKQKAQKAADLYAELVAATGRKYEIDVTGFDQKVKIPAFLETKQ